MIELRKADGAVAGPAAVGAIRIGATLPNSTLAALSMLGGGTAVKLIPEAGPLAQTLIGGTVTGAVEGSLAYRAATGSGSGTQTLPSIANPDQTAGGLFSSPNSFCLTCANNYSSGGFSNLGGRIK